MGKVYMIRKYNIYFGAERSLPAIKENQADRRRETNIGFQCELTIFIIILFQLTDMQKHKIIFFRNQQKGRQ